MTADLKEIKWEMFGLLEKPEINKDLLEKVSKVVTKDTTHVCDQNFFLEKRRLYAKEHLTRRLTGVVRLAAELRWYLVHIIVVRKK